MSALKNLSQMTQEETLQMILSTTLVKSEQCVRLTMKEDILNTNILFTMNLQQIVLSFGKRAQQNYFSGTISKLCKCVIGIAGENRMANTSSLEIISNILKVVPQHIIVLQRRAKPTDQEVKMQYRSLIWMEKRKKVNIISFNNMPTLYMSHMSIRRMSVYGNIVQKWANLNSNKM